MEEYIYRDSSIWRHVSIETVVYGDIYLFCHTLCEAALHLLMTTPITLNAQQKNTVTPMPIPIRLGRETANIKDFSWRFYN